MDRSSEATVARSKVGEQVRAVRRRWPLVALVALLAVTASLAYSLLRVPEYRSTADVLLSATSYDVQRGGSELTAEEIATQARVATSRPVANLVKDNLRLLSTPSLEDMVTVEALGSSRVLRFTARSSHPDEAAEIARAAAMSYLAYRQANTQQSLTEVTAALTERAQQVEDALDRLDAVLANGPDPGGRLAAQRRSLESQFGQITGQITNLDIAVTGGAGGELLNQPEDTTAQVAPRPVVNGVLSLLIGLIAGIALALTRARFDDVAHEEESLTESLDPAQVLGQVPHWKVSEPRDRFVTLVSPGSRPSQAFHELVARVRFMIGAMPGTVGRGAVVLCTSAERDEGKTDVAANLAVAGAKAGLRVIYVDADLRRLPADRLHDIPEDTLGLADVLGSGRRLDQLLVAGPVENMSILPAGVVPDDPAGLISSARIRPLLAALAERADLVVVDASPNAHFADSLEIAAIADVTLLVTRLGRSRRSTVSAAAERLHDVGAANLGAVVLGARPTSERLSLGSPRLPRATTRTSTTATPPSAPADRAQDLGDHPVRDRAEEDLRVRQSPRG